MPLELVISAGSMGNLCFIMLYLKHTEHFILVLSFLFLYNCKYKLLNHCAIFVLILV